MSPADAVPPGDAVPRGGPVSRGGAEAPVDADPAGVRAGGARGGAGAVAGTDGILLVTRVIAVVIVPFLVVASVLLFGFPDRTGELFAWAISPPLSAYMLASAYVGGVWFFVGVAATRGWHRVAPGFPAVVVFAGALLVATLLHLDRFSQNLSFYTWVVLYATTPFIVAWLWWVQRRADDGRMAEPDSRVPWAVRAVMLAVGAASLVTGAVMFLAPTLLSPLWAWDLTPLTARVLGAVLSLPGVVALGFLRDSRWSSFRILFQAQLVSLIAIVCSLIAGRDALHWDRPATPAFLTLITVAFVGYAALTLAMELRLRRSDRQVP